MSMDPAARGLASVALSANAPKNGTFIFNNDPRFLAKWRAARESAVANTADAKVLMVGDSSTFGLTASAYQRTQHFRLSKLMEAQGLPVSYDVVMGVNYLGQSGVIAPTPPSGWGNNATIYLSGAILPGNSTPWTITPAAQVTHFDIYYLVSATAGSFSWNVDGGADTTINSAGASADAKVTVSAGTLGAHTLNLKLVSGAPFIVAIAARNNGAKAIQIFNAGRSGTAVADWDTAVNPWDPINAIKHFAPDLTILNLTTNDAHVGTSIATYQAGLTAITAAGKQSGDVLMVCNYDQISTFGSEAAQVGTRAAAKAVGIANNCVVVDLAARWGAFGTTPASFMSGDGIHPADNGYGDIARALFAALAA